MNFLENRISSHKLYSSDISVSELINHYGCMQAQDTLQGEWCIGSRILNSSKDTVKNALENFEIVRTWPMRGTLHYVAPKYVHIMLEICASKTISGFRKRREFLGISDEIAEKSVNIMRNALYGKKILTRSQITETLTNNGIPMQTQWTYHLACHAGTLGVICFGLPQAKEDTFVLLDDWIKPYPILTQDEKYAEIARMYFLGHGFATIDDFAWWCGLGKTECKKAVDLIRDELSSVNLDNKIYYGYSQDIKLSDNDKLKFLGGFDEYFLGYKDRSRVADINHYGKLFSSNGIFFPVIVYEGRVIGIWRRSFKKDTIVFDITVLDGREIKNDLLEKECLRYTTFQGYNKFEINKL